MNDRNDERRLILIRHGLPDYRGGKRTDEQPGPPLSDIGRIQAAQAAEVVANFAPRTIYASPLARTRQTAEIVARPMGLPVRVEPDLTEWHRTNRIYQVNERNTRFLMRWLRGDERCTAAVSHASPLLSILRAALFLPHYGWTRISTSDRFEVSMASVFELVFTPREVVARCVFHPSPRIMELRKSLVVSRYARPISGHGENSSLTRPNWGRLIGSSPEEK
ncbi:MAG: histidine phosphatase family protein [Phycisphaerales bacterium]|nr:histidine phosphatase family protein [Phycisphaerales bacterium]